jgi:hypothetical protein
MVLGLVPRLPDGLPELGRPWVGRQLDALADLRRSATRLEVEVLPTPGYDSMDASSPLFSHYLLNEAWICEAVC